MGTLRYYTDVDGHDTELSDHEGFVEAEVVGDWLMPGGDHNFAPNDPDVGGHWTSSWGGGMPACTFRYRAACSCGWRSPIVFDANADDEWADFVADGDGYPIESLHDIVLEEWSAHADVVIADVLSLGAVSAAVSSIDDAQRELRRAVAAARKAGRSWSAIGRVLGVDAAEAERRFTADV